MGKYVKCRYSYEYEVLREVKVVYRGDNEEIAKALVDALLRQQKGDVYFIQHKRRRYILLDDEEYEQLKEKERNTKNGR